MGHPDISRNTNMNTKLFCIKINSDWFAKHIKKGLILTSILCNDSTKSSAPNKYGRDVI